MMHGLVISTRAVRAKTSSPSPMVQIRPAGFAVVMGAGNPRPVGHGSQERTGRASSLASRPTFFHWTRIHGGSRRIGIRSVRSKYSYASAEPHSGAAPPSPLHSLNRRDSKKHQLMTDHHTYEYARKVENVKYP